MGPPRKDLSPPSVWVKTRGLKEEKPTIPQDSLIPQDVPVLVGVEGQLEDAVHDAAFDHQLRVLQLLLAGVLPDDVLGHRPVKELEEVFDLSRFVVRRSQLLEIFGQGTVELYSMYPKRHDSRSHAFPRGKSFCDITRFDQWQAVSAVSPRPLPKFHSTGEGSPFFPISFLKKTPNPC